MSASDRAPRSSHRRFRDLDRVAVQGRRVPRAERRAARLLGLAFLNRSAAGPGLLIPSCRAVHTWGMRFPLDLHFLDADGNTVRVARAVRPGRFAWEPRARDVLELPTALDSDADADV